MKTKEDEMRESIENGGFETPFNTLFSDLMAYGVFGVKWENGKIVRISPIDLLNYLEQKQ